MICLVFQMNFIKWTHRQFRIFWTFFHRKWHRCILTWINAWNHLISSKKLHRLFSNGPKVASFDHSYIMKCLKNLHSIIFRHFRGGSSISWACTPRLILHLILSMHVRKLCFFLSMLDLPIHGRLNLLPLDSYSLLNLLSFAKVRLD